MSLFSCALECASQQDNNLATSLREVQAPSRPDMNPELGDTVAHRLNVAEKTSFKPLDPRDHNATNRGIRQVVDPSAELWECFDAEHSGNCNRTITHRQASLAACLAGLTVEGEGPAPAWFLPLARAGRRAATGRTVFHGQRWLARETPAVETSDSLEPPTADSPRWASCKCLCASPAGRFGGTSAGQRMSKMGSRAPARRAWDRSLAGGQAAYRQSSG